MMNLRLFRRLWPTIKLVLGMTVVVAVAWQFYRDLSHESLQDIKIRPGWLALSALLYIVGLAFSAFYWYRLLTTLGEKPRLLPTVRAYYLSQLGKYLPGKAWALMMRGTLVRGPEVKLGVALITTFYEVLTTMASGALLAAVVFVIQPPALLQGVVHPVWLGLLLLVLCGLPLLPAVFNRLVGRLAIRFEKIESFKLPKLGMLTLIEGLITTSGVWVCFGCSLWAAVTGVMLDAPALTVEFWMRSSAIIGLACVGGFVAIVTPGGVGVREWVLDKFLAPELAVAAVTMEQPVAIVVALVLRVAWTVAELVVAGVVWWLPGPRRGV
jgi:uncharacterized membrane protein YbhN (UPF0104 family)